MTKLLGQLVATRLRVWTWLRLVVAGDLVISIIVVRVVSGMVVISMTLVLRANRS